MLFRMRFMNGLIWERKNEHHRRWDNRNRSTGVDYRTGECDCMTSKRSQELFGKTERLEAEIKRLQEREWVGLTDEEIDHIWGITPPDYVDKFALPRMIEARLKEKNT